MLPATAKSAIPINIKPKQQENKVFLVIFLDKIGKSEVEIIPKKILIVEKIEKAFGIPMI